MNLYIARHGQTDDNAARILQRPDSPLSTLGQQQAALLAKRLTKEPISHILVSDYLRTLQTAKPIAAATGAILTPLPLLRERNFGQLRGLSYDELTVDPFSPTLIPPEGESWEQFFHRVARAWQSITQLIDSSEGSVLVLTHGLVCRALCLNHLSIPQALAHYQDVQNTALTIVEATQPWAVTTLNCAVHLDGERLDSESAAV